MRNTLVRALVCCSIHFSGQRTGHRFQCKYKSQGKNSKCQCLFVQNRNVYANMISCAYRENIGLLALTRIGSRRVVQISAGFMIFFSVLGNLLLLIFLLLRYTAMQFSAMFMYIFTDAVVGWWCLSLSKPGKFGALFASIPLPVFAGMYCLFFAYVGKSIYLKKKKKNSCHCLTVSTW